MEELLKRRVDRRSFVKVAGTGMTLAVLEGLLSRVKANEIVPRPDAAKRYAMVIDLQRCIGCEACTVACKVENNTSTDPSAQPGRKIFWNEVLVKEEDKYPQTKKDIVPRPCFHCENPSCVKACPVQATYQDRERGLVLQRYEKCIGCKYCAIACPYGARSINWSDPSWPKEREGAFNPEVPMRYSGIIEKCTFCVHRIDAAEAKAASENRPVRDGEIIPACNLTCVAKARFFGDLNDPKSEVAGLVKSSRAHRLKEQTGTKPKVFYLK